MATDANRGVAAVLSSKPVNTRFEFAVPSDGGATLWVIDIDAPGPP